MTILVCHIVSSGSLNKIIVVAVRDITFPTLPMVSASPTPYDFHVKFDVRPPSAAGITNERKRKRLRGKDAVNGLEAAVREGIILPGGLTCGLLLGGLG